MVEWRIIPSLPQYEASSEGTLRRIPRLGRMPVHGALRVYGGKEVKGTWVEKNKRFIIAYRGRTYRVARLVCEAFHGEAPPDKPYCLHIDEDGRNNRPENLMWGTQKENLNAPGFLAYCRGRTGENSPTIKARRNA